MVNMTLSTKLIALIVPSILITLCVAGWNGWTNISALESSATVALSRGTDITTLNDLVSAKEALIKTSMSLRDILISDDYEQKLSWELKRAEHFSHFTASLEKLKASDDKPILEIVAPAEKAIVILRDMITRFDQIWKDKSKTQSEIILAGNHMIQGELVPVRNQVLNSFAEVISKKVDQTKVANLELEKLIKSEKTKFYTSLSLAVTIGLIILMAAIILLVKVMVKLRRVNSNIHESSSFISKASAEFLKTSQSIAASSEESAAAVEQISDNVKELSSLVKRNAETSNTTKKIAYENSSTALSGREAMDQLLNVMAEIMGSSYQITEITKMIDEIAFQTNLLALNAAVEAARAGDLGKGFAVVADEVRNLAQRSASAAKEISQLIILSGRKIEEGNESVQSTSSILGDMLSQSDKLKVLVEESSKAATEQAQGISQIELGLAEISRSTQTNAASSEECAARSEELNDSSNTLISVVKDLTVVIEGQKTTQETRGRNHEEQKEDSVAWH